MDEFQCNQCRRRLPAEAFPLVRRGAPDRRNTCRACCSLSFRRWRQHQGSGYLASKREYWHRKGKTLREQRKGKQE